MVAPPCFAPLSFSPPEKACTCAATVCMFFALRDPFEDNPAHRFKSEVFTYHVHGECRTYNHFPYLMNDLTEEVRTSALSAHESVNKLRMPWYSRGTHGSRNQNKMSPKPGKISHTTRKLTATS